MIFGNPNYSDDFKKLNLDKAILEFLNYISTITDISIFNLGIWNYILTNNNYPNDIICSKDKIKNQSSFCSLFKIFQNSNEFCINYKKMFHWNICNKIMEIKELKSSPIFSIDDEDCQFNTLENIYNHRYTSYSSGCPNCIKNNIDSNAFVLISDIILPNFLVVAFEFTDFSPNVPLTTNTMEKGIKMTKNFLKEILNQMQII